MQPPITSRAPTPTRSGRDRTLDYSMPFLPAGLSLVDEAAFLSPGDRRTLSQVQARTHAAVAGALERITGAALLGARGDRRLGQPPDIDARLRVAGAKLRRRERLRELEDAMARDMPPGHASRIGAFVQRALLAGTWASLALALLHEHSHLAHRHAFEAAREPTCPAWREAVVPHPLDATHALAAAREFAHAQAELEPARRDAALDEFLGLVSALQETLAAQAGADARYFLELAKPRHAPGYEGSLASLLARAYRWQFLAAGAMERGFRQPVYAPLDDAQAARVRETFSAAVASGTNVRLAVAA